MNRRCFLFFGTRWLQTLAACLLAAVLAVAGCAPVRSGGQGAVELPPAFTTTGEAVLPEMWWRSFDDPALDAFMARALAGNLSLKATWERLRQAEALQRKAGAGLIPSLQGEAGASTTRYDNNSRSGTDHTYSLGLAASYEIDLWGRIRSSRDAARFDTGASAEDLRAAALTLSAQVAAGWYELMEKYGQLDLLDGQMETNRKVLELVTLQFRTGQTGIADVLQQRQLIEANVGERAQVAAQIRVLENRLHLLAGLAPGQLALPQAGLISLPALPETGVPAELVRHRPDVRRAWFQVRAADERTAAAVSERFPRLSLTAGASTSAETIDDLFDNWLASLAANLVAPLIDGGQRRAEVERSQAQARERLHTYGQTVLQAVAEVEDALSGEARQLEYLDSVERQLELAGQAIDRVRDRYLNGAEDYQRVLSALFSYQQLQRSHLAGQRILIQYRIDLCRALGTGWDMTAYVPES
ncbi:MAG: efflux transporter outer membrane subunit [Desulfuromonadales bacterium]|nr:efflux transporter outer membrane subunit [Desulfuromonadales bacterium]MDW7758746.1 efflux transporter outer membrane subunit [Desulfuromonadales bacterium]